MGRAAASLVRVRCRNMLLSSARCLGPEIIWSSGRTSHRSILMSNSIAVFGAGPGLGQAVARRYAREGYAVTLVGRRQEPLDLLAKELTSAGATAHVITADLSDSEARPRLAEQVRAKAGNLDAFYYASTPDTGFVSAANLTPQHAQNFMPLIFYTMLALVQELLPVGGVVQHLPGAHAQRGEQVQGAASVVVETEHRCGSRRVHVQPTTSRSFDSKLGSVDSLKVSTFHGGTLAKCDPFGTPST